MQVLTLVNAFATALSTFSRSQESFCETPADHAAQQWWANKVFLESNISENSCILAVPNVVMSGERLESKSLFFFLRLLLKKVFSLVSFWLSEEEMSVVFSVFSLLIRSSFFSVPEATVYWVISPRIKCISCPQLHKAQISEFLWFKQFENILGYYIISWYQQ